MAREKAHDPSPPRIPSPRTIHVAVTTIPEKTIRVTRQHLQTSLLMGVDFLPAPPVSSRRAAPPGTTKDQRSDTSELLAALQRRHDETCPHCTTSTGHACTVFGEGDPDADLMFVGEAPGAEEDRTGRPFVGPAGKLLDRIITAMGMRREQVYIANVLKSRPPGNRTPLEHETEACGAFLAEQIRLVEPRVIVTLGGPASKLLLRTGEGITRLRGCWATWDGGDRSVEVMPTFHPAYVLRRYTEEVRRQVWEDMRKVVDRLAVR